MTIALERHHISTPLLSHFTWLVGECLHRAADAWRDHLQAAILRRVDPDIRRDMGLSEDYVRADWQEFADHHRSVVAPAPIVHR